MKKMTLLFLCFSLSFLCGQTATAPSEGDGSSTFPYEISSLENLYWITADISRLAYHYVQTDDIDAAATSSWDSGAGWTPIGDNDNVFSGGYDGGGYTISNLTINRSSSDLIGLFGYTHNAVISNLSVTNSAVTGDDYVGILAGWTSSTAVFNCMTSGTASGRDKIGGMVGYCSSLDTLYKCYSNVDVTGSNTDCGGLVGELYYSVLENTYSTGSVNGHYNAGGLAGRINHSDVIHCYSISPVSGATAGSVGGLIAQDEGSASSVSASFWSAEAAGTYIGPGTYVSTTAELRIQATFSGWNFTTIWGIDPDTNYGFPYLRDLIPVAVHPTPIISDFTIQAAYPNPFNPVTNIDYSLAKTANVEFSVYNGRGCIVRESDLGILTPGQYSMTFNAADLPSGIYICRLSTDSEIRTQKVLLLK